MVTGDIINGSSSIGALIIVYSLTNDLNIYYNFAPSIPEQRKVNLNVVVMSNDEYKVSVFVLEESGLPFHRVAVLPKFVPIHTNTMLAQPGEGIILMMCYNACCTDIHHSVCMNTGIIEAEKIFIEYDILSTLTGVCITCTFLDSSTTDCVAVVHQQISQLSSSGLMNIELSHKFNRSGKTAYGCIERVNLEQYQFGVIGGVNRKMNSMAFNKL